MIMKVNFNYLCMHAWVPITYFRLKTEIGVTHFRLNRSIDENDVLMEVLEGPGYVIMQGSLFSYNLLLPLALYFSSGDHMIVFVVLCS